MFLRRRQSAISEDELHGYLKKGPTDHITFLSAKTSARSLAETLSALANANGGLALLGVNKSGTLQKDVDGTTMRKVVAEAGLLTEPPLILPTPQIIEVNKNGATTDVAIVQVPPGLPHIYNLQGRYLTRTANQNRLLTTPELRSLLLERSDAGFESVTVQDATLGDLDQRRVERYLDHIGVPPDDTSWRPLRTRGCVMVPVSNQSELDDRDLIPTVAGILLFGREPQRFVHSAEVICVRYADSTMSDEFVRQDIDGPLPEQIRQAEAFVASNMRRGMKITGITREETTEYPLPVVREAIVNAIAHRDYSIRGESIRLLMFNDRLEIYSPGRLPGHVTLDNLKDERYSRNEAIVAILSDLGYIERLGYGIDRMIDTMHKAGLPEPIFEETTAGFKVVLQSDSIDLVSSHPNQQPWHHVFLNERQERALAHIRQHGRITNSDYQALSPDISAETIRRDLSDLVEKNLLLRIGTKRATYYILKEG